ncbi:MAG TPA: SirB2 family protein [Woeseiaceae bacterium]|nr:SirB2 family protein [Woeseiaceae bacterium]
MSYLTVKFLHLVLAALSISGFAVRGYWMMTRSEYLSNRIVRIAPHVVDTVFLISGIWLALTLGTNTFTQPWLIAKILGLLAYIILGTIALKRGPTMQIRVFAFVGALLAFAYIVGAALFKSPASWLLAIGA